MKSKLVKRIKKIKYKLPRHFLKIVLIILAVLFTAQNLIFAANNLQNKSAIVGLKVNDQIASGLSRSQIDQLIMKQSVQTVHSLKLKYQNQSFEVKPDDLGVNLASNNQLTNMVLEKGREGSLVDKIISQDKALFGLENIKLSGNISQTQLSLKILEIKEAIDQDSQPISPDFNHNLDQTLPAKDGVKVQVDKLTMLIIDNIFNPPANPIDIPTYTEFANHHDEVELNPIRTQTKELVKQPITLKSGGLTLTLSTKDLLSMLRVVEKPASKNPKNSVLQLRLDDKKLSQRLGDFAQGVEEVTGTEFDHHDGLVLIYAQFFSGRRDLTDIPTGKRQQKVLAAESGPKIAYLTFDDGPNSVYQPLILDILKEKGVKATFFLVGLNTKRDLSVALRTSSDGHVIGNHSLTHSFLPNISAANIAKELNQTNEILRPVNHDQDLTLFRPPYGGVNVSVTKAAKDLNLRITLWDVDPRDWSEPPVGELVKRVVSHTYPGADILLHTNHLVTVRALPLIIDQLRNQGYIFETLK